MGLDPHVSQLPMSLGQVAHLNFQPTICPTVPMQCHVQPLVHAPWVYCLHAVCTACVHGLHAVRETWTCGLHAARAAWECGLHAVRAAWECGLPAVRAAWACGLHAVRAAESSCLHAVRCLCAGSACCARGRGRVGLQPMRVASVNG